MSSIDNKFEFEQLKLFDLPTDTDSMASDASVDDLDSEKDGKIIDITDHQGTKEDDQADLEDAVRRHPSNFTPTTPDQNVSLGTKPPGSVSVSVVVKVDFGETNSNNTVVSDRETPRWIRTILGPFNQIDEKSQDIDVDRHRNNCRAALGCAVSQASAINRAETGQNYTNNPTARDGQVEIWNNRGKTFKEFETLSDVVSELDPQAVACKDCFGKDNCPIRAFRDRPGSKWTAFAGALSGNLRGKTVANFTKSPHSKKLGYKTTVAKAYKNYDPEAKPTKGHIKAFDSAIRRADPNSDVR